MELLIGAPVARRDWIIDRWHAHAVIACERAGVRPEFLLVADPADPTAKVLHGIDEPLRILEIDDPRDHDRHDWANRGRFDRMVELRNTMLGEVRHLSPRLFLSLDSDILLHPDALSEMLDLLETGDYDAVGHACFMDGSRNTTNPSYGMFTTGTTIRRPWSRGLRIKVDVIMAVKLMSPWAYFVDYAYDRQGEDVGWSAACKRAGLRLGWSSRVISKHVMEPSALERVDPRCGY